MAPSPVRLTYAPLVHGDRRVDQVAAQRAEPREKTLLVGSGEAGEADDVGDKDSGELARLRHVAPRLTRRSD